MKTKFIYKILITIIAITFMLNYPLIFKNNLVADAKTNTSSEIVMEKNTNRVLYENNAYEKKYMASTTKILTCIVIIENCNLNDKVTIKKESTNIEGSSIYLKEGEILTVKELLYALMLRSGNDCAHALALHCSNNIKEFAIKMNETALKIGAKNSNFVNPHGLHDDNHFTTAYDLALISCYALKNPVFKEIVGTKKIKISNTKENYDRILINKNKMINEYEGATGIKTGYTKKAGRCLVSSAEKDGLEVVSVVLNCGPMFERSKELLDYAYNNYSNKKIISKNNIVGFIESKKGNNIPIYIKEDIYLPLRKNEDEFIKIAYDYPSKTEKILKKDEIIGFVKIYIKNNLIFEQKIYIMLDETI